MENIQFFNTEKTVLLQTISAPALIETMSNELNACYESTTGEVDMWHQRYLILWEAVVTALCHKRDTGALTLSLETLIGYLSLDKVEELYTEGFKKAESNGDPLDSKSWDEAYLNVKGYLESLPGYSLEITHDKYDLTSKAKEVNQSVMALEQHGYRSGSLIAALKGFLEQKGDQ